MSTMEQKVADKEVELERAKKQLQKALDEKSAATVRARREQVLSARTKRPVVSAPTTTTRASTTTAKASTPAASTATANGSPAKQATTRAPPAETQKKEGEASGPKDDG